MISVIIPAYNEENNIDKCLQSLIKQKYKKTFEIILVDNNSRDNTLKKAEAVKKAISGRNIIFRIISEKKQGRGAAKASGAKHAKGDILAYLDADSRAYPDWLSTIDNTFEDTQIVAATGPWRVYDLPDGFTKWFLHTFQETSMIPIRLYLGTSYLSGMNMAFRKKAYTKAGGFNEKLNIHDDFDLAKRIRKTGKIKYNSRMLVQTSGRRYKKGIIMGILSYHKGTLNYILGKSANLENIR